jgi:hypothetical protein
MTQPDLLDLAKQGNPKAIAALLNRSLQAKGITAKANLKENGYLQVMLEASQIPSRIPEFDNFLYRSASR